MVEHCERFSVQSTILMNFLVQGISTYMPWFHPCVVRSNWPGYLVDSDEIVRLTSLHVAATMVPRFYENSNDVALWASLYFSSICRNLCDSTLQLYETLVLRPTAHVNLLQHICLVYLYISLVFGCEQHFPLRVHLCIYRYPNSFLCFCRLGSDVDSVIGCPDADHYMMTSNIHTYTNQTMYENLWKWSSCTKAKVAKHINAL